MNMSPKLKTHGFTLLEVLVSMIIFAIGMLGLAGMQGIALKDNNDAYHRSQAVFFAHDLGDRIRANPAFWDECILKTLPSCLTPATLSATESSAEGFSSSNFPFCSTDNPPTASVGTVPTGCDIEQLAQYDWYQIRQNIIDNLPSGGDLDSDDQLELSIDIEDGQNVIAIKVSWSTTSTGVTSVTTGDDDTYPSFTYKVRP